MSRATGEPTDAPQCSGLLALPEPPDAVFCFNDLLALGAIRACIDADVAVPDQVAIAGFDDIQEGQFSNPTLTTISTDLQELAAEALRLLLSRLSDEDRPPVSVTVPWSLLTRESTATAPATETDLVTVIAPGRPGDRQEPRRRRNPRIPGSY